MAGYKHSIRAEVDYDTYELLEKYCEKTGLTRSRAVATILAKTFELLYDENGNISNLDELITKDKMVESMPNNSSIDMAELRWLLQENVNAVNRGSDLIHQVEMNTRTIAGQLSTTNQNIENYIHQVNAFRFDFQSLKNEVWGMLQNITASLEKLSQIFKV